MPVRQTSYPCLRENLHPDFQRLSDQHLESLMSANRIDAEMAEGFFSDLGKFASGIGKTVVAAAPSILPVAGTVLGGAFGGPIGASLGGSLGRLAGGAIGGATQPGGVAGALAGALPAIGGSPAAGQLLQTVLRPETLNALMSMVLGPMGKPNVSVGSTPVPVGAFTNLLGVLSNRAASEYNASTAAASEGAPLYMRDYAGEALGDAAVAEHRAEALYGLLERTPIERDGEAAEWTERAAPRFGGTEASEREAEAWELMEVLESFETD